MTSTRLQRRNQVPELCCTYKKAPRPRERVSFQGHDSSWWNRSGDLRTYERVLPTTCRLARHCEKRIGRLVETNQRHVLQTSSRSIRHAQLLSLWTLEISFEPQELQVWAPLPNQSSRLSQYLESFDTYQDCFGLDEETPTESPVCEAASLCHWSKQVHNCIYLERQAKTWYFSF
jgi:hypothetical protein